MLAFAWTKAAAADGVDITRAQIEASDEGYRLSVGYAFELNHAIEDAIVKGVPMFFTTELELTKTRWYWRDERTVVARQTSRIRYDLVTRQYHVNVIGSIQQSFGALDDALAFIRRPGRWLFAPRSALKKGEEYNVSVRMRLDREYLSKPIRIDAINNSEWRLDSPYKIFTYKAE